MSSEFLIVRADARHIPLADNSVQCVVTSPPYFGLRKYDRNPLGSFGTEKTVAEYIQHTVEFLREVRRVLRPDGVVWWNIADSYAGSGKGQKANGEQATHGKKQSTNAGAVQGGIAPAYRGLRAKNLCLIPQRVVIAAQEDGWIVRDVIIWHKPNPMTESMKDRCTRSYETILMLTKFPHYYYNAEAVKEPSKYPNDTRKSRSHSGQKRLPTDEVAGIRPGSKTYPFRNPRNVWSFPTKGFKGRHFATFPEELPRRCILATSRPGDVVLDPFGGSGTTAKVAVAVGRRAVSIDLAYHDIARERIAAGCRQARGLEKSPAEPLGAAVDQGGGATLQEAEVPLPGITDSVQVFREDSQGIGIWMPCPGCGEAVQAEWRQIAVHTMSRRTDEVTGRVADQ